MANQKLTCELPSRTSHAVSRRDGGGPPTAWFRFSGTIEATRRQVAIGKIPSIHFPRHETHSSPKGGPTQRKTARLEAPAHQRWRHQSATRRTSQYLRRRGIYAQPSRRTAIFRVQPSFSLAPGFNRVFAIGEVVQPLQRFSRHTKPLKRLNPRGHRNTRQKPGANEIAQVFMRA